MNIEQLVFIGLGGNIGNTISYFEQALKLISDQAGIPRIHSSVYQTEPWGFEASQPFLNQVIGIDTSLTPTDFLKTCMHIEKKLGRIRQNAGYSSRCIDIDIILWKGQIINEPDLQIPHPLMAQRRFVLEPLCEIAPMVIHPLVKLTIRELFKQCDDRSFCQLANQHP